MFGRKKQGLNAFIHKKEKSTGEKKKIYNAKSTFVKKKKGLI